MALPKGAAPPLTHPTRWDAGPADGQPAVGVAVVWRTQARPPPARGTKPAETKARPTPVALGAASAFLRRSGCSCQLSRASSYEVQTAASASLAGGGLGGGKGYRRGTGRGDEGDWGKGGRGEPTRVRTKEDWAVAGNQGKAGWGGAGKATAEGLHRAEGGKGSKRGTEGAKGIRGRRGTPAVTEMMTRKEPAAGEGWRTKERRAGVGE